MARPRGPLPPRIPVYSYLNGPECNWLDAICVDEERTRSEVLRRLVRDEARRRNIIDKDETRRRITSDSTPLSPKKAHGVRPRKKATR